MENKTIKILLAVVVFFEVVCASEVDLVSERYILYNMNDNSILLQKGSHDEVSIASLTKIMTVIVAIENISDYNDKITIKKSMIEDIDWDVAITGFKVGEKVSYDDLLYAAILSSGADAVNALAESISGSRNEFVNLMNQKVNELGLKNTHFQNAIGLYSKSNYSSAYDMAQILTYALKNKKFKTIFETNNYKLSNGKKIKSTIEKYNQNNNLNISFITGSKTGYISKAGFCLASTATLNNVNYLLITLNAFSNESSIHIKDHIKAYNYFNNNYSYKKIVDDEDIITTIKTKYAKEKNIDIKSNVSISKYLKNDFDKSKIEYIYNGKDEVSYFTHQGTKLGIVKVNYNGETLDEFDLIYHGKLTFSILAFLWINKLWILFSLLFIFLLIYTKNDKKKKYHKHKHS